MDDSFEVTGLDGSFHGEQDASTSEFSCNECTYTSKFKHNLVRHKHAKHPNPGATTCSPSVHLICDFCGLDFKSKYGLRCHIKSKHENTFKYKCDACGRGFQGLWNFRGHLRSHNDALKESCSYCSKKFVYKSSLLAHEKSHQKFTARKVSVCTPCDNEYKDEKNLKEHKRGFHGGKKYTCLLCLKAFRWRSSLAYHLKHVNHP